MKGEIKIMSMKVKELEQELRKRKLDTTGKKAVLQQRLIDAIQSEVTTSDLQEPSMSPDHEKTTQIDSDGPAAGKTSKRTTTASSPIEQPNVATRLKRKSSTVNEEDISAPIRNDEGSEPSIPHKKRISQSRAATEAVLSDKAPSAARHDTEASKDLHLTSTLCINNFRRPFTLNAVKQLVQQHGEFVENGFWMDSIKTHCYVTYPTTDMAVKTFATINGQVWPVDTGLSLQVNYSTETALEISASKKLPLLKRKPNGDSVPPSTNFYRRTTPAPKTSLDSFFMKTETKPMLYYLPLTREEVQRRKDSVQKSTGKDIVTKEVRPNTTNATNHDK